MFLFRNSRYFHEKLVSLYKKKKSSLFRNFRISRKIPFSMQNEFRISWNSWNLANQFLCRIIFVVFENKNIDENDNLNFTNINIFLFWSIDCRIYENRNEQNYYLKNSRKFKFVFILKHWLLYIRKSKWTELLFKEFTKI